MNRELFCSLLLYIEMFHLEEVLKKIIGFLASMKFAVIILFLLGLLSIGGTLIPQDMPIEFYLANYGDLGNLIWNVGLHKTFSSWWYIAITILLCLSLLLCVILRIKPVIALYKAGGIKRASGKIGSWILHVGILLTILFFALGNIYAFQSSVYNVPGTTTNVPETGISVDIDEFDIILRADDSVETYKTVARFKDSDTGELIGEGPIEVNHPMVIRGYQFSQSSFGFAVDCEITKDGESIGKAVLFEGEFVSADKDKIFVQMTKLYPNVEEREDGLYNASQKLKNPMVEYNIYYSGVLVSKGMTYPGEEIIVREYGLSFNNPRHFTQLDIRRDPFAIWAGVGSMMLVLGIFISFYGPTDNKNEDVEA